MSKRLFDVILAATGLLIFAPVMLVAAIAVRLESPGPVLFRQTRITRGGRPFKILKFRSMQPARPGEGPLITVVGDARITAVGGFLRRTKLDELPQLINVLRGDMSLVGPRPEVPRYVELYPPDLRTLVLSVRPGITDEASIEFRNESALLASAADPEKMYVTEILPRKLELYARYARGHSLLGDVQIIARTIMRLVGVSESKYHSRTRR